MLESSYNEVLVSISFAVAILASYTALDMASRVTTSGGRAAIFWLIGGSFAMGFGIWSMHFIGMLAFSLPIALGYDLTITFVSLVIAIAASGGALWLVTQKSLPLSKLSFGSVLIGIGIAGMHYTGMGALRMQPWIIYDTLWVLASVVVAIGACAAAMTLAFHLRRESQHAKLWRTGAAFIMAIAIVGMHYTGMMAASFPEGSICGAAGSVVDVQWLAVLVVVITMSVIGITLIVSILDGRMQSRTSVLATSLAEANYELMQLALHDILTRLPNRILLEDRMKQALNAAQRNGTSFAVMFIDLDGFKAVNDAYGHQIGDHLLVSVSERLQSALRAQDTLARIGGDEFVVLASVGDATDASTLANKLAKCASELISIEGHDLRVSASIGIVMYPGDGADERELMLHADAAMYHMKNAGRNGYSFFEASMNKDAQDHLMLMNDLRVAQERDEFFLDYQPKYQAPVGPISGFEALLRWQHPTRGLLGPDVFLPIAEKTGMIIPIGQWVLNEACRQLKIWHELGHKGWTVSVNLSACQFEQDDLVENVRSTIVRHGIPAHLLTLEVTESIAMKDADSSIATLNALTALGVKASIDDFGTGYSSLLYLKRLPASELKIDKAFVHELTSGSEDEVIVSAIVALAKALGLTVVAEGVETLEQQTFLTNIGCESLQGFYLDKPLSVDTINNRIRSLIFQTKKDLDRGIQEVLPLDVPGIRAIPLN